MRKNKESKTKEPKRKPKYGFFSCAIWSLKYCWKTDSLSAVFTVAVIPLALILTALGIYLPAAILDALETAEQFVSVVYVIVGLVLAQMIFALLKNVVDIWRNRIDTRIVFKMIHDFNARKRDMDYFLLLRKDIEVINNRALDASNNNHTAGVNFLNMCANIAVSILSFVLFGTAIAILHPAVLAVIVFGGIINYFLLRWLQKKNFARKDILNALNIKQGYFIWNLNYFDAAKDIRIFGIKKLIAKLLDDAKNGIIKEQLTREKYGWIVPFIAALFVLLRDGLAYAILIYMVVNAEISTAEFVMYFSAVSQVAGFFGGILSSWSWLMEGAMQTSDYREFFDIKDVLNRGKGIPLDTKAPAKIEFKNVSFKYPEGEKQILDNVSFCIEKGEKIAIVGVNGAGKTTLTRLMSGLLIPDEGEVLINGHSVFEYNRDELYSLFSVVPQHYAILPTTIEGNICMVGFEVEEEIDRERLDEAVKLSGLKEKIDSLPNGIKTNLNKRLYHDATELSGGEYQKLLLARAIYHRRGVLVLDEPTAALDPIAEDKLYRSYNEIVKGKTALFISHRLASTRFCDRIFFLDEAKLAQVGTHEELLNQEGKYRELFEVQAHYYREEATV